MRDKEIDEIVAFIYKIRNCGENTLFTTFKAVSGKSYLQLIYKAFIE